MKLAIVLLLAAGCAADPVDVEPGEPGEATQVDDTAAPEVSLEAPGEHDQGQFLLGDGTDNLAGGKPLSHISADADTDVYTPAMTTITHVKAVNGVLQAFENATLKFSGSHDNFDGMVFQTSNLGGDLLIIKSATGTGPNVRYMLTHKVGTTETDYCKTGGAIVTSGYWTTSGLHRPDTATITFSCDEAVITKCFGWGYRPGDAEGIAGPNNRWTVHQGCTRMARADYCAVGEPHTMDETSIVIRDLLRNGGQPDLDTAFPRLQIPTTDPAPPDQYWFEAAWQGGSLPVKCLSKERWKSLPIGGYCPGVVDDPRKVVGAHYCDEGSDAWGGSVIYNASKVGQLYLNRWTNGSDELVTVRGVPGVGTVQPIPPFDDYQFVEHVGLLMRNPPGSIDKSDLDAVNLMSHNTTTPPATVTTDRVVSLPGDPDTANYTTGANAFEGYLYVDNPEDKYIALKLWRRGTDLVTAVLQPATDFSEVRVLGFIDPIPPPVN